MESTKGEYTGSWIPAHVMLDTELIPTDKLLFAMIASWRVCFASNDLLAERMGMSKSGIDKAIRRLKKKGYIKSVAFDGRKRFIKAVYDQQGSISLQGDSKSPSRENIDISIDIIPTECDSDESQPPKNKESVSFNSGGIAATPNSVAPPSLAASEEHPVYRLFWLVVKKYSLPVTNANHIRKWSKDLEKMDDGVRYLESLLSRDLRNQEGEFRPTLNSAFDIIQKKLKIQRFYNGGETVAYDPRVFGEQA